MSASRRFVETAADWTAPNWLIAKVAPSAVSMVIIAFACCAARTALDVGMTQAAAAESSVAAKAPAPSLQLIHELQTPGEISAVTWSSDGTKLAASSIGQPVALSIVPSIHVPNPYGSLITIWDSDGHLYRQIKRSDPFFSFDDTFAFVGGDKQIVTPPVSSTGAFSLFDTETGEVVREIPGLHPDKPRNVNGAKVLIASPDQSVLAVIFGRALAQQVVLYSTREWIKLADIPAMARDVIKRPETVAFSGDGKLLAIGYPGRYVQIYDLTSGLIVQEIDAFADRLPGTYALAFSPDGSMIAAGSHGDSGVTRSPSGRIEFVPLNNSPVRIFRVLDGVLVTAYGDPSAISSGLTWRPDGRIIVFITQRRILHIWNPFQTESRERTIALSGERNSGPIALSPDGAKLAVGVGRNVRLYQIAW
jgi:WD40 repeat protein